MDVHLDDPESVSETQRVIADALKRNAELSLELQNDQRVRRMKGPGLRKEVAQINAQVERQLRRCHELELYNDSLRKKIQNARKRSIDQKRMRGGEAVARENARLLKRQTEILEDKLNMVR